MGDRVDVVNVGLAEFSAYLHQRGIPCRDVDWKPPGQGDPELADILFRLTVGFRDGRGDSLIDKANRIAFERILSARPILRRVRPARELLPQMGEDTLLHAGPAVSWADMCGPMRGALIGALRYEGRADSEAEAAALIESGRVRCRPTHRYGVVAPMVGVVSPSMPLFEVENAAHGNAAYAPINEGVGHVLRFGANNAAVIQRLRWLEKSLAPALDRAIAKTGGIELKRIMAQALLMGDEMHQRNAAAGLAFHKEIATAILDCCDGMEGLSEAVSFLTRDNEQFFLNLAMAASKSAMDPAHNIPNCSLVTAMSRNGVDFGLTVSGLGDTWVTAPSLLPRGLYFPGFSEKDANPDMGDSAIIECYGLGGFAMAAALTVARFLGAGSLEEALDFTLDMEHICFGSNPDFSIPNLDFGGAPTGIDVIRVVATGILPVINSGVAHREAGIGQVGAGLATPPMEAMNKALRLFHEKMVRDNG